jgi:hypothetical protein
MSMLSKILSHNGLPNLSPLLIEPHRNQTGAWRIKFSYETQEPLSMAPAQASELVTLLQQVGEAEFARELEDAIRRARRYASM